MATNIFSSSLLHTSDAEFAAWGSELNSQLSSIGLVQTSDTGQINWASPPPRPGIGLKAGYEIWRFNDTLQATAPIFFKLEYGTGTSATSPRIWVGVGTGTDGAGTLTGLFTTQDAVSSPSGSSASAVNSYISYSEGFFGLVWKINVGATNLAKGGFGVCRTVDIDGNFTPEGCFFIKHNGVATVTNSYLIQTLNFDRQRLFLSSGFHTLVPGNVTSSLVGSDNQAYLTSAPLPKASPVVGLCGVIFSEFSLGTTFSVPLVGVTSRNYISLGRQLGTVADNPAAVVGVGMLWE